MNYLILLCLAFTSAAPPTDDVAVPEPPLITKAIPFELPAFLTQGKPKPPVVFGNAAIQGEAGGLYAANNNTLISMAGPNSTAIASLNSTSYYFAKPINETNNSTENGWTSGQNLAGFTVTAQEDTHAFAQGDWIQFINHGGSYATALGESQANGTTENEGGSNGWGNGNGWGWKEQSIEQNQSSNPI